MTTRRSEDVEVMYVCECGEEWTVDGRFDAEGNFGPFDETDANCPDCGDVGTSLVSW